MTKPIIGIDLGTTLSALAFLDRSGEPRIAVNSEGDRLTPSVLYFPPGEKVISVGQAALAQREHEHSFVLQEVKRKMSTPHLKLEVGGHETNPVEASSKIIRKLVQDASVECGSKIESAVITVPAKFAEEARRATMEAGRLAGLNVQHIINEPTAAALYYAHAAKVSGRVLIFDLGGGTFDATIADIRGRSVHVITSEGDQRLGGSDFDRALLRVAADRFQSAHKEPLIDADHPEELFLSKIEGVKKQLSSRATAMAVFTKNSGKTEAITFHREEFEDAIAPFVAKAITCVEVALQNAQCEPRQIESVLLVGGSTRIPVFQRKLEEIFGKPPVSKGSVDEAVALGACVYAGLMAEEADLSPLQRAAIGATAMQDVTNHYFGTVCIGENGQRMNSIILSKDSPIPCEKTEEYSTIHHGQTAIRCTVTQSEYPETDPEMVKIVHEAEMALPPGRPAGCEIRVTYSYDSNQIMHCKFLDVQSGRSYEHDMRRENLKHSAEKLSTFTVE